MSGERIRILDEKTINQIAAGEVIENPASVVKELVENAIDSGAQTITVETQGGGRGLVRVSDDGLGMAQDDLVLSLERHATSKLTKLDDLDMLGTLGFRGEALPSIASVSKLSIHSTSGMAEGVLLLSEGGKILKVQPLPRKRGTTVEVKSLFFNVPVRKKFQKSLGWDKTAIHKVLTNMSLCFESCGFIWISDGEEVMNLPPGQDLKSRIASLLGESFSHSLFPVEHKDGTFLLRGFSSQVSFHRPNRTGQYLFLNKRAVFSPFISRKVVEGYGTRLAVNRFPLFILHLSLPPNLIDVNVHPQKREVRLREEHRLGPFITEAIERNFSKKERPLPTQAVSLPNCFSEQAIEYAPSFFEQKKWFVEEKNDPPPLFLISRQVAARVGKYLLVQEADGIRVVDSQAAHLRIAYEKLIKKEVKNESQQLLLPIQVEVSSAETILLSERLPLLEEMGFSIRQFGEHTFIVDAIPSIFDMNEVTDFIHAYLDDDSPNEKRMAKALGKALKPQSEKESEKLVDQLFECQEPDYTPEGRPTHVWLTEKELERKFK